MNKPLSKTLQAIADAWIAGEIEIDRKDGTVWPRANLPKARIQELERLLKENAELERQEEVKH